MGTLKRLLNKTIYFTRSKASTFERGQAVAGSKTSFTTKGSIQPEKNLSLIRETFGSHVEAAIKIYTLEKLRTKESEGGADVIDYDGRAWEVSESRHYDDLLPHYKSVAIMVKDER